MSSDPCSAVSPLVIGLGEIRETPIVLTNDYDDVSGTKNANNQVSHGVQVRLQVRGCDVSVYDGQIYAPRGTGIFSKSSQH